MASKSAHKRKLIKQGTQVMTVTTRKRVLFEKLAHKQSELIKARESFGRSFNLDTPTETPAKWSRISQRTERNAVYNRYSLR